MTQPTAARPPASATPRSQTVLFCLTGFMGSGKTTVGKELARSLGSDFIDLDRMIEAKAEMSVAEIFEKHGEQGFRKREREALAQLLSVPRPTLVLALGGGAIQQPEVAERLAKADGLTIFLDAPVEELYRRCVDSLDAAPRPLLKDLPSFKKLYAERSPAYRRSQWHVDTYGRSAVEVAAEIAAGVRATRHDQQRKRS